MAGYEVSKSDLDRRMGSAVVTLRQAFEQIERINTYLGRMPDAELTEMGYSTEEIALIKSAFGDLTALAAVSRGEAAQPAPTNFFAWGGRLTGLE